MKQKRPNISNQDTPVQSEICSVACSPLFLAVRILQPRPYLPDDPLPPDLVHQLLVLPNEPPPRVQLYAGGEVWAGPRFPQRVRDPDGIGEEVLVGRRGGTAHEGVLRDEDRGAAHLQIKWTRSVVDRVVEFRGVSIQGRGDG
jgi:hypothetical protein